jgi:tripartite-type tricarboxylate transporter receptor subunit TctC
MADAIARNGMKAGRKVFIGLLCGAAAVQAASPQSYPARPIRLIIPVEAGSSTIDAIPRALAQHLSTALGQPMVMDNRPGASGQIGTTLAARSAPDGYTLLVGYTTSLSIGPSVHAKLGYDPAKDIAPVARLAVSSFVVAVSASIPVTNIKELIALAKARPGQLNFASAGTGSTPHLCGELLKIIAKIDMVHVPYKASGSAMTALAGGEAQVGCQTAGMLVPLAKAGKLRALAVASNQRLSALPDTPTAKESGLSGFEVESWTGIMAPANTPEPVIRRLYDEIAKIVNTPEMKTFVVGQGATPALMDPATFGAYITAERVKWAKVIKAANVKPE